MNGKYIFSRESALKLFILKSIVQGPRSSSSKVATIIFYSQNARETNEQPRLDQYSMAHWMRKFWCRPETSNVDSF